MNNTRKIIVLAPVLLLSLVYAYSNHFLQYRHLNGKRLIALVVSILLFYIWAAIGTWRRKQDSFSDMLIQSSFYVYIFCVLTLTGYFIFFNQVSAHGWWQRMGHRIDTQDGVNLTPLLFMRARHLLNYGVVGNFIMLLPLGVYLPLMYKNIKNFFSVTFVAMLFSVSIELMQLATNSRITDIDDVILNTSGAAAGFILYFVLYKIWTKPQQSQRQYQFSS